MRRGEWYLWLKVERREVRKDNQIAGTSPRSQKAQARRQSQLVIFGKPISKKNF